MRNLSIIAALILTTLSGFSQNICATSFKRNNGNGTCGALGQLQLTFPGGCPTEPPIIDSVYINGEKSDVTFGAPDKSKCGGSNGYISYCVTSGNMPPANVWTIYFRTISGGSYNCLVVNTAAGALPVKFVSFDAVVSGNTVICKWSAEDEINNNHFELERSFDGKNFSTIAYVFANEGNAMNAYKYTDKAALLQNNSIVYYRIKQVDNDGKLSYSNMLTVKLRSNKSKSIEVSPNPFAENLVLKFESGEKGNAEIKILSVTGQTIVTKNIIVGKGINNLQIGSLNGLSKGVYVAQLSVNGTFVGNQKIVKN